MQIINSKININYNVNKNYYNPNFKAMKKADFRGIDFAVVEKFKAPIEKFDVIADFQNWAGRLVEKIKNTNFLGRQAETIVQRKGMLKDWFNYVIEENGAYTKAIQLLILSAITKNLGEKDDNLPPTLNRGVLADCVSDLNKELEKDKKTQFDFNKMYQNKLRAYYLEDTKTGESGTKWVVISSKEHDPENFEANVDKLKTLSHKSWCTKSYNAEPYLREGDFHIYLENGEPKIGIRFIYDEIEEIQGELNNSKIPFGYYDVIEEHVNKYNLKLNIFTEQELEDAKLVKQKFEKIKQDLANVIKTNDATKTYEYFGIKVEKVSKTNILEKIYRLFGLKVENNKKDKLILSEYMQPDKNFTYKDLGIDENKLFKNVIKINGYANFRNSNLKSLSNLESIGNDADFRVSQITDLGHLKLIGENAYFGNSKLTNLGNLQSIGRDAIFDNSNITDLGNLQKIGGNVYLNNSKLKSSDFKNIKVGGEIIE